MRINLFRMIQCAIRLLTRKAASVRANMLLLSLSGLVLFAATGHAGAAVTINSAWLDVADPVQSGAVVYVQPNGLITGSVTARTSGGTNWRTTSYQIGADPAYCQNAPNVTSNNTTSTVSTTGNAPSAEGSYNVIFRVYSGSGCSGLQDTQILAGGIVVDGTPPAATINCGNPATCGNTNPTSALQVTWNISFSEIVTGLNVSNFSLSGAGAQGATITSVSGSGTSWTVTAATGANGVLTLNLDSNLANIRDRAGNNPATVTGNANNSYTVSIPPRNCTSRANGNWSNSNTWTSCGSSIPRSGDTVTIGHAVTLDVNTASLAAITINSSGSLSNNSGWSITVSGNFSNAGTYAGGSGAVSIGGNFTNTGTFNAGTSIWTFNGSSAQSITGAVTFSRLTIDNAAGVTASGNLTVSGALALSTGIVSMGSNTLAVDANCTTALSQTAGFVDGRLRLQFPSGSNVTCTYHVGSGGFYAPATVVMSSSGGRLTGSTASGDHPNIATSGLNASKSVNRYWSLWRSGDTIASVSSYAVTLNFQASDVDSGAAWGNFIIARYVGGAWSKPGNVTAYTSATAVSGLAGLNSTNDFAIGEDSDPCPVPAGFSTCVCDNFGRAALNPSTIYNGDWIVSHSGDNPFEPITFNGALRLTDNSNNVAAAATVPGIFPAAGNNITVEFRHYAYRGTNPGADGIALTLSDSSIPATAGAFGGSLGYAQKTGINGFGGGWLGVGIDEYGNYPNPTEGRVGGPGLIPQTVTLRGSGSGSGTAATNYPFIATSGALSPVIDDPASTTPSRGALYRITVDARNYTWNGASGNKNALVLVERDTTGTGNNYVTLPNLNLTNIYSYNTGQANVPNNWKLSFTGATGGSTNIHEIKALKVCSTFFVPPGSFDIQANTTSSLTCASPGGNPSSPIVTVRARNNQGLVDPGYVGTVTLTARTGAGALSGTAVWRKVGTGVNIPNGGSYTFVAGDGGAAQFYLTDTAAENLAVTIADASTSTTSPTPISFSSTASSYIIEDAEPAIGAVAGRPHLMKVTYYSGCGATAVAGSKNMSGWYARDASDPNGVAPRMCPAPSSTPTSCLPDGSPQTCANPQLSTAPPGGSNLTLNFNGNSSAYFCLKTTDVGKYYPQLRETADPSAVTSSAPLMTLRPFAVVVSGIKQGATGNPVTAGTSAATVANGGARFISAGSNFETTVGGYLWNAAGDANFDGIPDANSNFAALTGGGVASHYADSVGISAVSPFGPSTGMAGTLTGGPINVAGGSWTQLSLAYNEVGSFTLAATPSTNYLSSGINLSNRVAIFSNPSSNAQNKVVGRFFPHHFSVTGTSLAHGCTAGNFTYEGQPFSIGFTIQARNANDALTSNYGVTGYAPLASGALLLAAENANDGVDRNNPNRINPALPSLSWTNGSFTYSGAHALNRAASAEGPFPSLDLGLKITDNSGDSVPLGNGDMNASTTGACSGTGCTAVKLGTTAMRYGRLRIDNAYGSELLPLNVQVEAQYWNSATGAYVKNTDDNCSSLAASNFTNPPAQYAGATVSTTVFGGGILNSGTGILRLNKPSSITPANQKGSVRLQTKSPLADYLPGSGIETFGIYKSGPVIYLREVFQ